MSRLAGSKQPPMGPHPQPQSLPSLRTSEDGEKKFRHFFANIDVWGPQAKDFLSCGAAQEFHSFGLAETHVGSQGQEALKNAFLKCHLRPVCSVARASKKSESGTSGGVDLATRRHLAVRPLGSVNGKYTAVGLDWAATVVKLKGLAVLLIQAYFTPSIRVAGENITKLLQIQELIQEVGVFVC